jgi:hypothetical protein
VTRGCPPLGLVSKKNITSCHAPEPPPPTLRYALQYLLKHWHTLTQFLRVPGAPIDNNTVEVRFVDPKPNLKQVWGMDPELRRGNDLWLKNLILV